MRTHFFRGLRATILTGVIAIASILIWSGMQTTESTLEIRSSQQGISIPDGFFVSHHLNANGIRFNSITPDNNSLLIKFDSSAQSEAAKAVLYKTLPHGYVIAQQEEGDSASNWLTRVLNENIRIG
ncbi:EnvZ/OmpR regulon moderator MzrA [Buttiauxella warmboldiae]|uniref:Modulator protein MzrA n=1 Tax=Buttiauxella warmboldiae TaxID=82993 RepID=A0A3N5EAG6_9ENTR|nr:EnvZ/OmpR regulon moderator MzrA [Buttiauxella warmboldiae]RPH29353.1 EnvZ/OmpR regulon moderator MzrA [Buttiauxella warmboldiae]